MFCTATFASERSVLPRHTTVSITIHIQHLKLATQRNERDVQCNSTQNSILTNHAIRHRKSTLQSKQTESSPPCMPQYYTGTYLYNYLGQKRGILPTLTDTDKRKPRMKENPAACRAVY
jgi:hypothetical protein